VSVAAEDLFFLDTEVRDGREVIREVRWYETQHARDGYAIVNTKRIRRIFMAQPQGDADLPEIGHVELFELRKTRSGKTRWVVVEQYTFDMDEIPLVTFYAEHEATLYSKPPLEGVVNMNIAHWQSASDQRNVLTAARFPIIGCSGGIDEKKIVVGPYNYLFTPDPNGKFYYVEHTGAAIAAGRTDLQDIEAAIAHYGAEFLKVRPGSETATARALDSAEATSPLQDVALRFTEALNVAMRFTAKWLKLDNAGELELCTDYGIGEADATKLTALGQARTLKDISRETYVTELKAGGVLSEDFDAKADALLLEQEALDMFGTVLPPMPPDAGGADDGEVETQADDSARAAA
jgi:hypothetical protein